MPKRLIKVKKFFLISFDLRKAFDTICDELLLLKLTQINISDSTLRWFESYLHNRYQIVKFNRNVSNPSKIEDISIPKGGNLSAILFVFYVNNLTDLELNGQVVLYADDLTLKITAKTFTELQFKINEDINKINRWLINNRLVLNSDKSLFMIMSQQRNYVNLTVKIGTKEIRRVNSFKLLGVEIDHNLHFETHINSLCTKLNKFLNFFTRFRHQIPNQLWY
jgi:hypothetical protein